MLLKFFGVMDFIVAASFILAQWGIGSNFVLIIGIYVILKSLIFLPNFTSAIDLIGGIYLLLIIYGVHDVLSVIFILWFLQKSFFSLAF